MKGPIVVELALTLVAAVTAVAIEGGRRGGGGGGGREGVLRKGVFNDTPEDN